MFLQKTLFLAAALTAPCLLAFAQDQQATLTVQTSKLNAKSAALLVPSLLSGDADTMMVEPIGKNGQAVLKPQISHPIFVQLVAGKVSRTILINPGDEAKITIEGPEDNPGIRYSGKSAAALNYTEEAGAAWKKLEVVNGNTFLMQEPEQVASHFDTIRNTIAQLDERFFATHQVPENVKKLLVKRNFYKLLTYKFNYAMVQFAGDLSRQIHPSVASVEKEMELDDALLATGMFEYQMSLIYYQQLGVQAQFIKGKAKNEMPAIWQKLPLITDQQLQKDIRPDRVRTFMRARNLIDLLDRGISPESDSLTRELEKEPQFASYRHHISKKHAMWLALSPGKPAPGFAGVNPQGEKLSIGDLKNKVVYVDVWATWCAPCIAELPHSKTLQEKFKDRDDVAFMFVSIDRDQNAWKQYLTKNKDFTGIHMNQAPGPEFESFWKTYQFRGIPRYILIDKEGKLANANAARPSSPETEASIQKLLN